MSTNSTYANLLTTAANAITALALGPPVVVRKLPLRQEVIDPSTQIVVCPGASPEVYTSFAFGHFTFEPLVQIVIVSPNNADEVTPLTTLLGWRESIAAALGNQEVGLALSLEYDVPLDRELISEQYDYLSLGWRVTLWV